MMSHSATEQLFIELTNRARQDPQAEALRQGIAVTAGLTPDQLAAGQISTAPLQPLAGNAQLLAAARDHTQWQVDAGLIAAGRLSHSGPGGNSPEDRILAAGYALHGDWSWGENLAFWGATDFTDARAVLAQIANLWASPGHRLNILAAEFTETGIGAGTVLIRADLPVMVSTHVFAASGAGMFLTGVVIADGDGDGFYDLGEGRGGAQLRLLPRDGEPEPGGSEGPPAPPPGGQSGDQVSPDPGTPGTTSAPAGGYSLQMPGAGWQLLGLRGTTGPETLLEARFSAGNIKLDLLLDAAGAIGGLRASGDLRLQGGPGMQITATGAQAVRFEGGSGDDTLIGGAGDDTLLGGPGSDLLHGGGGKDDLHPGTAPGAGYDVILGSPGDDIIRYTGLAAENGAGLLLYARQLPGAITVVLDLPANQGQVDKGSAGRDSLIDAAAAARSSGGLLIGGTVMADEFRITIGADQRIILNGVGGGDRFILAGAGVAELRFDALLYGPAPVRGLVLDLAAGRIAQDGSGHSGTVAISGAVQPVIFGTTMADHITGHFRGESLNGFGGADTLLAGLGGRSSLYGGLGDDSLTGSPWADVLDGGGGHDRLFGGAARDSLYGGQGNDWLDGGEGHDSLWGGTGHDSLYGGEGDDLIFGGEGGRNVLTGYGGADSLTGSYDPDLIYGGRGNDQLWGQGGNDSLYGRDDHDLIWGGAGNDLLSEGAGDDSLYGGDGHDALISGDGRNLLAGEAGHDTLTGGAHRDLIYGGAGNDLAFGAAGADSLYGRDGNDTFYGDAGADLIYGDGGDDQLYGGVGDDTLYGGAGADLLGGGEGNDLLVAGSGADTLYGGAGADWLVAGAGAQGLYGGAGADVFEFLSQAGAAEFTVVVGDFDPGGGDRLRFSQAMAGGGEISAATLVAEFSTLTPAGLELRFDSLTLRLAGISSPEGLAGFIDLV